MPVTKMGLVDYVLRHPNQKAEKVCAHAEEFIVANLDTISASICQFPKYKIQSIGTSFTQVTKITCYRTANHT